jgi:hypothetical protein
MKSKIKIAQFGLGPIGVETLRLAANKPRAHIVGAIDIDPSKVGRNLNELTRLSRLRGCKVFASADDLIAKEKPDIIFHTAVSRFKPAFGQLEPIARRGISIVSSCEELLFPQLSEPKLASRLDNLCRRTGARIVAAGVNPGFAMDLLPLFLTGVCRSVKAIRIHRVVNASTRRKPLQRKIGSGLPPKRFHQLFKARQIGHAGLKESLALVAHCLGWKIPQITETCDAVVTNHTIRTEYFEVNRGQTCGLHQRAQATTRGGLVLSLDLQMYLDAPNAHDAVQIEGDPPVELIIKNGIAGDQATVAALVNTGPRLFEAKPGLLLLSDLSMPRIG